MEQAPPIAARRADEVEAHGQETGVPGVTVHKGAARATGDGWVRRDVVRGHDGRDLGTLITLTSSHGHSTMTLSPHGPGVIGTDVELLVCLDEERQAWEAARARLEALRLVPLAQMAVTIEATAQPGVLLLAGERKTSAYGTDTDEYRFDLLIDRDSGEPIGAVHYRWRDRSRATRHCDEPTETASLIPGPDGTLHRLPGEQLAWVDKVYRLRRLASTQSAPDHAPEGDDEARRYAPEQG